MWLIQSYLTIALSAYVPIWNGFLWKKNQATFKYTSGLYWIPPAIFFSWKFIHLRMKTMKRNSFNNWSTFLGFNCKAFYKIGICYTLKSYLTSRLFSWGKPQFQNVKQVCHSKKHFYHHSWGNIFMVSHDDFIRTSSNFRPAKAGNLKIFLFWPCRSLHSVIDTCQHAKFQAVLIYFALNIIFRLNNFIITSSTSSWCNSSTQSASLRWSALSTTQIRPSVLSK